MKTDTLITAITATLATLILIMLLSAFGSHGSSGFFNMGTHHNAVDSAIMKNAR